MIVLYRNRELPARRLHWLDGGLPADLSTVAYSWSVSIIQDLVETSIAGATVTPNPNPTTDTGRSTDVPSLTVSFSAGALDNVSVGPAVLKVVGTVNGLDREGRWEALVR